MRTNQFAVPKAEINCGYHRITHVLVNDPTRGYGIFIENMLEAAA
jgi:hypothetical protein